MKELSRPALIDHTAVYLACARAQARAQLTDTPDIRTCEKVLQQNRAEEAALKPEQVTHNLTLATLIALVPIPIAWLLAYVVLALVRWVRRGFQPAS
jgi:hypothetical protein